MFLLLMECHVPDDIIMKKLMERYCLTEEEARQELSTYKTK